VDSRRLDTLARTFALNAGSRRSLLIGTGLAMFGVSAGLELDGEAKTRCPNGKHKCHGKCCPKRGPVCCKNYCCKKGFRCCGNKQCCKK